MIKPNRKIRSLSATVLTGLAGIVLSYSPPDAKADIATAAAITRTEDGLASSTVTSIYDLAARLRSEQSRWLAIMPPGAGFTLRQACGMVVFDPKAFPDSFTSGLIGEKIYDSPVYSIILVEDPDTRETVIANADDKVIAVIKPEEGYNPYWYLEMQYPDLYSGLYSDAVIKELIDACDPSHIQITLNLLPADFVKTYAKAVVEAKAALALNASKSKTGGGMLRYQSSGMTNLEIVGIERATNGTRVTLAYPDNYTNRVDFFTCPDLIANWWDLAVSATNVNSSTNFITWVDVNVSAQAVRFYNFANADQDLDFDGIPDGREMLMYHTSSTNWDSDYDGLSDSNEVFSLHTDPNNPKTNKPDVWIFYPTNESRKVWIP